ERQQRANGNEAACFSHSEQRRKDSYNNASQYRSDPGSAEFWMHSAYKFWKQTIVIHRPENPRLSKEHHENYGADASDCAQLDYGSHPADASVIGRHSDGVRYVELQVL